MTLHSTLAGEVYDVLNDTYPGLHCVMEKSATGELSNWDFNALLRTMLPNDVRILLEKPTYSAWTELHDRFVAPLEMEFVDQN